MEDGRQSRRELFDIVYGGRSRPPPSPALSLRDEAEAAPSASSSSSHADEPESLEDIRQSEADTRQSRLHRLFATLKPGSLPESGVRRWSGDDELAREQARQQYAAELWAEVGGESRSSGPTYDRFEAYVLAKERELYRVFHSCDLDNDSSLSKEDLRRALNRAGLSISPETLDEFFHTVDKNDDGQISFREWRDVFLLMPRHSSLEEIFRFYAISKAPRHTATQVTSEGDSVLTDEPKRKVKHAPPVSATAADSDERRGPSEAEHAESHHADDDDDNGLWSGAGRSFLAGGIAGAVSRTATAPFDRLKVYLINATPDASKPSDVLKTDKPAAENAARGLSVLKSAVRGLYQENGWRAFFVGNGLNIAKIFPESAIRYASYEMSKRALAQKWDMVEDPADISTASRFLAGGIGGITSQLSIYWLETLKTRCMSSTSSAADALRGNALVVSTAKLMWQESGFRAFFRGLPLGLIGVFPYSAIDMTLYEAFRKAYIAYYKRDEPGPISSMIFGATSGGLGATSVYPLNLIRTRMQTQGTPAHPQRYGGFKDVVRFTYRNEGWHGFYKGLTPTLLKVAPSVGISWMTFEAARSLLLDKQN